MIPVCDCSDLEFTVQNLGGFKECKGGIGIIKSAIFAAATKVDGTTNGLTLATTAPNAQVVLPVLLDKIENLLSWLSGNLTGSLVSACIISCRGLPSGNQ